MKGQMTSSKPEMDLTPRPPSLERKGEKSAFGPSILGLILLFTFILSACVLTMDDQPRYEPLEQSEFFPDGRSARPLVPGTVPRGEGIEESFAYTGLSEDGTPVDAFPFEVTRETLERGRERYDIFCSPCHGQDGYGKGMIVQRGFSPPPSLHDERLRQAPAGHFYDVITNGYGQMYAYGYRVKPSDRWAIVAYIRALQLSQNATEDDVPAEERQDLQEAGQ